MKFKPLVSVIIPAYNAQDWIEETIESVLTQVYQNIEIIVINDGSTDNTDKIVKSYGQKVRYYFKENGGQSSARNHGIKNANGKYIAFLDSDDLWEKDKLCLQVELLEKNEFKWAYTDGVAFDSSSGDILFSFNQNSTLYDGDILIKLFQSCFIPMPSVIVNKEVFFEIGYFNEDRYFRNREDWEMWIRIAAVYPIALIPKLLVKYRVHQNSVTRSESSIERMNGNILVVKAAALREPTRLGPLKNALLSKIYFSTGRSEALIGNTASARKYFKLSILHSPIWILPYISFFIIPITPWIEKKRKSKKLFS
jgi:glycosyltransferase involved in cell wall biosynthesis